MKGSDIRRNLVKRVPGRDRFRFELNTVICATEGIIPVTMSFIEQLNTAWQQTDSLVCVGLDPDLEKLPSGVLDSPAPIYEFNRRIIDQTAEHCCCFKPQIAYYAAYAAESQLEQTIRYIKDNYPEHPVILDAKRGDIGATAGMYALEAYSRYAADAVTVNPYMGGDTLLPFLEYAEKGVVILCRTSNAGSSEFQALDCEGMSLAHRVAQQALVWNTHGNIMLVTGATYPEEIGEIQGDMARANGLAGARTGQNSIWTCASRRSWTRKAWLRTSSAF